MRQNIDFSIRIFFILILLFTYIYFCDYIIFLILCFRKYSPLADWIHGIPIFCSPLPQMQDIHILSKASEDYFHEFDEDSPTE
jgi:hypothetical protein